MVKRFRVTVVRWFGYEATTIFFGVVEAKDKAAAMAQARAPFNGPLNVYAEEVA
jgi:hypothetical protein